MYGEHQFEMRCAEFEALLAEALDGTLTGEKRNAFEAHRASCGQCGPMYAEAEAGLRWLDTLSTEIVEPPARLMDNILKATSWARLPEKPLRKSWWQRVRELPGFAPLAETVLQPRFAMSFAMAFFSVSVLFSLSGYNLRDVRRLDLRPSSISRDIAETKGKVLLYYENMRFVYDIESRVRDLKRATTPEETTAPPEKPKPQNENRTGEPDRDKYRNYSLDEARPLLAAMRGAVRQEQRRWL